MYVSGSTCLTSAAHCSVIRNHPRVKVQRQTEQVSYKCNIGPRTDRKEVSLRNARANIEKKLKRIKKIYIMLLCGVFCCGWSHKKAHSSSFTACQTSADFRV